MLLSFAISYHVCSSNRLRQPIFSRTMHNQHYCPIQRHLMTDNNIENRFCFLLCYNLGADGLSLIILYG
jgi:hypothetical protein